MVMVEVETLITFNKIKDLDQSQAQAGAEALQEVLYLENLDAQAVATFIKEVHVLHRMQCAMDLTRSDIFRQCAIHPGRIHSHVHPHKLNNLRLCKKYMPMTRTLVKQKMLT